MLDSRQPIEKLLSYVADESSGASFHGMIGHPLAIEILSQELDVESKLARIYASGHQGIIEKVIKVARTSGGVTVEIVNKLIDNEIDQIRRKAIMEYTVAIPLSFNLSSITLGKQDLNLTVQGIDINFGPFEKFIPSGTTARFG